MSSKPAIPIDPLQQAILIGGLLGDMHIQRSSASTQRCRLRFCHSTAQKDYVDWKYAQFKDGFCQTTKPPGNTARPGEYLFYTSYRDEFVSYRKAWYRLVDGEMTKVVPNNIQDLLVAPVSLAVWYLDDGTKRQGYNGCRLATQSFTLSEVELLRDCLKTNFYLRADVDKWSPSTGSGPIYGLSFPSNPSGYQALRLLIYDFVRVEVPSMLYKLQ
jgi:hypothetical protein